MRAAVFCMMSVFLASAGCLQTSTLNQANGHVGPTRLGEFSFDVRSINDLMKESELVMEYGSGYSEKGKFAFYCFEIPQQDLYVRFRPYHGEERQIMDIFVSDRPSCPAAKPPIKPFKPFVTGEGLKLGDSYKKVVALYGEPLDRRNGPGIEQMGVDYSVALQSAPFGDVVLRYGPRNEGSLHSDIYLRDGKVSAILISLFP